MFEVSRCSLSLFLDSCAEHVTVPSRWTFLSGKARPSHSCHRVSLPWPWDLWLGFSRRDSEEEKLQGHRHPLFITDTANWPFVGYLPHTTSKDPFLLIFHKRTSKLVNFHHWKDGKWISDLLCSPFPWLLVRLSMWTHVAWHSYLLFVNCHFIFFARFSFTLFLNEFW